jgi:hypothetical protein
MQQGREGNHERVLTYSVKGFHAVYSYSVPLSRFACTVTISHVFPVSVSIRKVNVAARPDVKS